MTAYLKCDEPDCDHVEYHKKISAEMIGKPCPKCGANLLTEEDFRAAALITFILKPLKFLGLMKEYTPGDEVPEGMTLVNINPHKDKLNITEGELK